MTTPVMIISRAPSFVHTTRYARNGKIPDAMLQGAIHSVANHAARHRTKEPFRFGGGIAAIPSSAGAAERPRWRFAFHTGPFCKRIRARVYMATQDKGGSTDPYCKLTIKDGAGVTVGTAELHASTDPSIVTNDVPSKFRYGEVTVPFFGQNGINVSSNTDYYGYLSDFREARMIGATVFEETLGATIENGYMQPLASVGQPILDTHRSGVLPMARSLFERAGSHCFNWSTNVDTEVRTAVGVVVPKNVVDNSSTAVSAATPGWTLDMRGKRTLSNGSVPVMLKVYASGTSALANNSVYLKDSTGATVIQIQFGSLGLGWHQLAGSLPSTLAKYDLHYGSAAGTTTVYAASLFELT